MTIILEAKNIRKSYFYPEEIVILDDISLTLSQGESIAITGSSGEGKSTLLHILGTLEQPCDGSLIVAGNDVFTSDPDRVRNQHIGFVFQNFQLLDHDTVMDNILMPARIARQETKPGSACYKRAKTLLKKVNLLERADFPAKLLSGGEKQRVSIVRALCNDPDILLADEPSGNLDHHTSKSVHRLLLEFASEYNKALIVATHDQELAGLCSKVYTLQQGRLYTS